MDTRLTIQISAIVLASISIGISAAKHGQPTNLKYNAWIKIVSVILNFWLLSFMGFWEGLIK